MSQNVSDEFLTVQGEIGVLTLFGLTSSTEQTKWQNKLPNAIHGANFIENSSTTILVCHGDNGELLTIDLRQSLDHKSSSNSNSSTCSSSSSLCYSLSTVQNSVVTLSSTNQLKLYDTRQFFTPVAEVNLSSSRGKSESPYVKVCLYLCRLYVLLKFVFFLVSVWNC